MKKRFDQIAIGDEFSVFYGRFKKQSDNSAIPLFNDCDAKLTFFKKNQGVFAIETDASNFIKEPKMVINLLSYDSSVFSDFNSAIKGNGLKKSKCDYSDILKSIKRWSVASQIFHDVFCSTQNTVYGFMNCHGCAMTIQEIDYAIDELGYKTPYDVLNAEIIKQKEGYKTTLEQSFDFGWWWNIRDNEGLIIVEGVTNSYQIAISRINAILQVI